MTDYRVNLDVFAGPLDLLLYLIRKEEVDIYDIPIARVTEQYLRYLDMLKSLNIDLAGDFLVMAATLMQIKSAMLLPKVCDEPMDDDLIDPRTELIRQLLEYKKFKDIANMLADAAEEQKMRFPRPDSIIEKLKPNAEPAVDIEQVSVWDLIESFNSIMEATGSNIVDISHITDETPIDLYQIEILHRLQTEGELQFEKIFKDKANRLVMVGLFLALLELIRENLVAIEKLSAKKQLFCLRALTSEPAEEAVKKAILSTNEDLAKQQTAPPSQQQKSAPLPSQSKRPAVDTAIPISELPPKSKQSDLSTKDKKQKNSIA